MTFQAVSRRWLLVAALVLLLIALPTQAQDNNLLTNPGFEDGFRTVSVSGADQSVAQGWEPFTAERADDAPSFQNAPPTYFPASEANDRGAIPRIRSGEDAQVYWSFFETHDAGIYQEVSDGISSGDEVRFSVYGYVLSTSFNDLNVSEEPGDVALRVGIDPTGGTDPYADSVQYSESVFFYDTYRQYSVIAEAESDSVTVFIRSTIGDPVQFTYVYLDDAVLEITPESDDGGDDDQPTEAPTDTPAPTSTPNPTETPAPTDTPAPTATDDNGEVEDPTPTREIDETDEPDETEEPTPTDEGIIPTATPIDDTDDDDETDEDTADYREEFPGEIFYTVQPGDTVQAIAREFDSSIDAIIQANDLNVNAFIRAGQRLTIPVRIITTPTPPTPTPLPTATPDSGSGGDVQPGEVYIVRPRDTLLYIARQFGTTVETLATLNGITNPNRIVVGQRIILPADSSQPPAPTVTPPPDGILPTQTPNTVTYIVQPGDTLFRIALRYGTTLSAIAERNNIANYNRIFTGQRLTIPQ